MNEENIRGNALNRERIIPLLDSQDIDVFTWSITGSTNDTAREMLKQRSIRTAVLAAEEQTAGRGRKGHTFFSPSSGLYYSLVLKPEDENDAIARMTIAAAVSLHEAIMQCTGIECDIKWVNDLYLNGRKIAGILCEAPRGTDGSLLGIITGIGINIHTEEFPEEIRNTAGSLNRPELDKNVLTAALTNRLMYWSRHLRDPRLLSAYKAHSFLLGKQVSFLHDGTEISGTAVDINDDGNLVVEADRTYVLSSGEVSLCGWNAE